MNDARYASSWRGPNPTGMAEGPRGSRYHGRPRFQVVWSGDWPKAWKDIQLPERKSRLIKYADTQNKKLNFLIFRNDLKAAWEIDSDVVSNSDTREVSNRFIPRGEMFYIIPIEKARYIEL